MHCQIKLVLQQQEEISGKLAWVWPCGARARLALVHLGGKEESNEGISFWDGFRCDRQIFHISLNNIQLY